MKIFYFPAINEVLKSRKYKLEREIHYDDLNFYY